jgi:hypothetical protein
VKTVLRRVGLLVAFSVVFLAVAAAVAGLAGLGVSDRIAAGIGWAAGAALAAWRLSRTAKRKRAAARVARDRTAGEELHRGDRRRYAQLLEGTAETLVFTDPDVYVGQQLSTAGQETKADGKKRSRWWRASAWQPPTTGQRETIDELTEELERATLVRSLDDGSAEVVGVKDCVGFRYRVDTAGEATLVSSDESQARGGRRMQRLAGIGIAMFVGSFIVAFVYDHSGRVPGWLVPFFIVGFVLGFFGLAGHVGPRHLVEPASTGTRKDAAGTRATSARGSS